MTSDRGAPSLADLQPVSVPDDAKFKRRLRALQLRLLYAQNHLRDTADLAVCVVFEGMDAAGKGGAIRRLSGRLDPRGYRVHAIGAPVEAELRHHYLWRFASRMPQLGEITVFDRSWYGRVLVERVEGFATVEEWERAYDEIVGFERMHAADRTLLVKFWLHVSPDEQLKRFREREADPFKEYKITPEDWRNRDKRAEHEAAADEMFRRTHWPGAPWILIHGDDKQHARLRVLEEVVARVEELLPDLRALPDQD
jgi:AMP-polyphosphate phosphotransferase